MLERDNSNMLREVEQVLYAVKYNGMIITGPHHSPDAALNQANQILSEGATNAPVQLNASYVVHVASNGRELLLES